MSLKFAEAAKVLSNARCYGTGYYILSGMVDRSNLVICYVEQPHAGAFKHFSTPKGTEETSSI